VTIAIIAGQHFWNLVWESWAIACAKTVRPPFIHHCSADAASWYAASICQFSVQIVLTEFSIILLTGRDLSALAKYFTGHRCGVIN